MTDTVFMNTFEVDPTRKEELLAVLREGTEVLFSRREGFVSSMILVSSDGSRVVNVTRWASADAIHAVQLDPAAIGFARKAAVIAKGSPGVFTIAAEWSA